MIMVSNMQGRGCAKYLMVIMASLALVECALAVSTYIVGDSVGWGLGYDYKQWEQNHTFVIGDTLVFNYPPQHSVLQVTENGYQACDTSAMLKSYTSGNDRVMILDSSTFFICGTVGHCAVGMKLAIITASTPSTPINPSPSTTINPNPSTTINPNPTSSACSGSSSPLGIIPQLSPTISGSISLQSRPAARFILSSVAATVPLIFFV